MPRWPSVTTMVNVNLDQAAREHVWSYLAGDEPLEELEKWLAAEAWDDRTLVVAEIDHALAERSFLSEDEFQERLRQAVSTVSVGVEPSLGVTEPHESLSSAVTIVAAGRVELSENRTIIREWAFAGR